MLEVLFFRVPHESEYEKLFALLRDQVGRECYEEVRACHHPGVGVRKLLGEALVGYALRVYWKLALGRYQIARGEKGKPYVVGLERVCFNISHSGEYVVCVVSDAVVGIDIEKRAKARMEVAGRFFHEEEVQCLTRARGVMQDELFYDYWSVKESFLKCIGTGLARPLNSFIVQFSGEEIVLREGESKLPLHVTRCRVDSRYACHVCHARDESPGVQEVTLADFREPGV